MLEKLFGVSKAGSSIRTELLAGLATFLTMAYITIVNPLTLATDGTGMEFGAVFTATIIAAVVGTLIMGLWANWPVALAPGMGLNAYFTYTVILNDGYSYQQALTAVFVAGVVFIILSVSPARKYIINSIPKSMKLGIGAGIGLFLAIIGLQNAGIIVDNPATLVGLGDVASWPVLLAGLGFIIMAVLSHRKIPGAIVIGILVIAIIAWIIGEAELQGVAGSVPSPTHAFQLDFSVIATAGFIGVAFAFLFVDFLDTAGTITSIANLTGRVREDGEVEDIDRTLLADSSATVIGALAGTSNTTSYIESGAGIKEGGKTGLTAVTVAVLFAACLFFAPLAQSVPAFATAPALIFIATYFLRNIKDIDWDDISEYVPAALAAIIMPLTYSIAYGIAIGFVSYVLIKALSGKGRSLNYASIGLAVVSVLFFVVSVNS
ncbi:MAG: NCS2 family permease [Chloroflexi bacterium]|jgi:AGZA family xanthine/uracil permease-like MFS transporter|nr:NCS2 family permease [Chloroflexota bacterium]MBT4142235.1 NCS2 family permease [Chloroflexota bacterium]MBT4340981.1 NCS2 family permease [Chloroflexota bacterium]MBT4943358.1 NCS2 family permease [Chloroflexota bacterium]MBT5253554.1 NCS2 family permease [Chloroflexota bacterium]